MRRLGTQQKLAGVDPGGLEDALLRHEQRKVGRVQYRNDDDAQKLRIEAIRQVDGPAAPEDHKTDKYDQGVEQEAGQLETEQISPEAVVDVFVEQNVEFLGVASVLAEPVRAAGIIGVRRLDRSSPRTVKVRAGRVLLR